MDATFHESDERLELYALDRLSDSDVIRIEEHLLICDSCRERLDATAAFAFAIRDELKNKPLLVAQGDSGWFGWLEGVWKPRFAPAGALALALVAAVAVYRGSNPGLASVATLQLTAMRGAEVSTVARARELHLTFGDAPSGLGTLTAEVVDSNGAPVWKGEPVAGAAGVQAKVPVTLAAGEYFARLYDSQPSGSGSHLLHEYAFRVK